MKARNMKVKAFTATKLVPDDPPAADSLEELLLAWLESRTEEDIVEIQYGPEGANYTALVFYVE